MFHMSYVNLLSAFTKNSFHIYIPLTSIVFSYITLDVRPSQLNCVVVIIVSGKMITSCLNWDALL